MAAPRKSSARSPTRRRAAQKKQRPIDDLLAVMARLRDPQTGCPWDVKQDFATIAPYTIEEAYEVADAIARRDLVALRDELGDLLLQVVFHARMAEEQGRFDFEDVARGIADKMVRRHPHVFGNAVVRDAATQRVAWESHKAAERAAQSVRAGGIRAPSALDGVALALPALLRAAKLQRRAARVGFDWKTPAPILAKIEEELAELRAEMKSKGRGRRARLADELGDLLFSVVNLARRLELDPEAALRGANAKFERRFRRVEALLRAAGKSAEGASLAEMEALWQRTKLEERAKKRK
ncbi:MAG TPA: nucleoside triphosphate pyrophosphohydrolase [Alphaproteobacteria bacterium]|nr:nucleoside triphosphate pyrophosphohydrolase [Alphaproteobacteria bacterium]